MAVCISGTGLLRQFYVLPHCDKIADKIYYFTSHTGPTSPSDDPKAPGAWQGSHWIELTWKKIHDESRNRTQVFRSRSGRLNHLAKGAFMQNGGAACAEGMTSATCSPNGENQNRLSHNISLNVFLLVFLVVVTVVMVVVVVTVVVLFVCLIVFTFILLCVCV